MPASVGRISTSLISSAETISGTKPSRTSIVAVRWP